jgi:hypothetical protein
MRTFYEKGLQPYIKTFRPEAASDWPPGYNAELFRAKTPSGQRAYRSVILPTYSLARFGSLIRDQLESNGVEWAEGLFFLHTVRGIKQGTQHSMTREAAQSVLSETLREARIADRAVERGSWWVDVGLEFFSKKEECLQWMTVSHHEVVQNVLQIDPHHAIRITKLGSSKYSRDISSHLPAVSGCRIEPGQRARGPFKAAYLQLYTTDKSVTYHPRGRHHAKQISVRKAMDDPMPYVQDLCRTYEEASGETSSNARVEVRVPFDSATEVLIDINYTTFRKSMLSFPRPQWW